MADEMHDDVKQIAFLIGTWRGEGKGSYPTIDPFAYGEEVTFSAPPRKPLLAYAQRTWHLEKGYGLHSETGYFRSIAPGRIEIVIAHPFGIGEIDEGTVDGGTIAVTSTAMSKTSTAKEVAGVARTFTVEGDILRYEVSMAAVGHPMLGHLEAELHRVS